MLSISEELKAYTQKCFDEDADIEQKINVCDAFKSSLIKCPKVVFYVVDDAEDESYNTFDGEEVSVLSVQITCYSTQLKIAGVLKSAQDSANYLCEVIRRCFQKKKIMASLSSVLNIRRVGRDFAIPFENGDRVYMSPIRFQVQVENNE